MSKTFTVIGYWRRDRPVSVGVIEGEHAVHGGESATEEGDWATSVEADSPENAEVLAIKEMRENDDDDDFDDDDEEGGEL